MISYFRVHTHDMSTVRRTISLPPAVADQLDNEAKRRGVSFSALIAELADAEPTTLSYSGLVEDDADLSLRVEEVLARLSS